MCPLCVASAVWLVGAAAGSAAPITAAVLVKKKRSSSPPPAGNAGDAKGKAATGS